MIQSIQIVLATVMPGLIPAVAEHLIHPETLIHDSDLQT